MSTIVYIMHFLTRGNIILHVHFMRVLMTSCPLLMYLLGKEQQNLVCIIDVSLEEEATSNIYMVRGHIRHI